MFRNLRMHWLRVLNPAKMGIRGVFLQTTKDALPKSVRSHVFKGIYEEFECCMVEKNIRQGDRVLEIGTGIGLVSLLATSKAGEGNVLSCEANPALEAVIRGNYALNNWQPNLLMKAVTADGRDLVFHQDPNVLSSSSFDRNLNLNIITVPSVAMREVMALHKPNVLIVDVEGGEIEILPSVDLSDVNVIIIELHPHIVGKEKIDALLHDLDARGLEVVERSHKTYLLLRQ